MASAVSAKVETVKLFLKELKQAVRKENESPTKIRSFNKLLRRVPGIPFMIFKIVMFVI
jgi:hypothetical protein